MAPHDQLRHAAWRKSGCGKGRPAQPLTRDPAGAARRRRRGLARHYAEASPVMSAPGRRAAGRLLAGGPVMCG
jgi:hypothetical protein